jgi:uncharacterized cupredoxin-like copper-binding protein
MRGLAVILVAAVAVVLAASPVGASDSKTLVTVRLKEFKVIPTPVSAKRGVVVFSVRNAGKVAHELVVLKTNVAAGKLRVKRGRASLAGRVGRVGPLKPGASRMLMLTLAAGKYVLLCNLPGHYQAGQRIGFRVS